MKLIFGKEKEHLVLEEEVTNLKAQLREASYFISEIEKGNFQVEVSNSLMHTSFGDSLASIQRYLRKLSLEEKERQWFSKGVTLFFDILRNQHSKPLPELCEEVLSRLASYLHAIQATLFVAEDSSDELIRIAGYATEVDELRKIKIGEGLIGQSALERNTMYITTLPADYIQISSGLGATSPSCLLITPLVANDRVVGVLELAFFRKLTDNELDFIKQLSGNIAIAIKSETDNYRTIHLLNESQQLTENLRAQEEELRQNLEEMQTTQEEMAIKNREIARKSREMEGTLSGINETMATIEFTPDGIVLGANERFLKVMKCALGDIRGIHHRLFVPEEIHQSEEYKSFWKNLAAGIPNAGIFKRINDKGETVWLNAIYNPIFNENGGVEKVVKFAVDVTAQQESIAENAGVLGAINATMATIEFAPDGTILDANTNFLNTMKCTLKDIQYKHHRMFLPEEMKKSEEYKLFWQDLAMGKSNKGVFKRVNAAGEIVWLEAIYNPIVNAEGNVIKVIKFATDLTAEQEMKAENSGILKGINATMATIEFTLDGIIKNANDNFLATMKCSLEDIVGKHHQMFVPEDLRNSLEYELFWKELAKGNANAGIFRRVNAQNEPVYLNAIYNPIRNSNGEIVKVIKFATDITAEKLMETTAKFNVE